MPRKSVAVLAVLAVAGGLCVWSVCRDHGGDVNLPWMFSRVAILATVAMTFGTISVALQRWMQGSALVDGPASSTVVDTASGPGQYKVSGVDHASNMQTTEYILADTAAQAKIKVELKGVDVAVVERV